MKTFLLIISLGAMLAAALVWTLRGFDPSAMSIHGWIALGLGTFFSIVLGAGLMMLVFHSARHGYDDRADTRDRQDG